MLHCQRRPAKYGEHRSNNLFGYGPINLFLPELHYAGAGTSYDPMSVSLTSRCSVETVE